MFIQNHRGLVHGYKSVCFCIIKASTNENIDYALKNAIPIVNRKLFAL